MRQKPFFFKEPQIYFPKLFKAVPNTVPHIALTSKEAVEEGYSFRKKRHSVKITGYHGKKLKQLLIPYSIDGMPVDEIRGHTFEKSSCTTVYIHEKIRRLGEGVFKGCNVKKAVFEDGITSLSAYTFYECKALEKVLLPRTLKNIGERCFMFCKALRYIEFPESLCNMGYQAFCRSGLEDFAVEALTPGINNADVFSGTPLIENNQVVCTYPDKSDLTVLHVNSTYCKQDIPIKFKAASITFCCASLWGFSIDLSECGKVRFYRNAVCDKRETRGYRVRPSIVVLPENEESKQNYAFPEYVTVANYFPDKNRKYNGPAETDYDDSDDSCVITPVADFLPAWTVDEEWDKIRIKGHVRIGRNAINAYDLQEIIFEDFCPEDMIFSLYCFELRKVSFNYKGGTYTKYIPPRELVTLTVTRLMTLAFTPCSAPSGRTVYDRRFIDSIFEKQRISSDDNSALATLRERLLMTGWQDCREKINLKVTKSKKALIAVDVLRSDRLGHEPPVDMYFDFLRAHRTFCYRYFRKISAKYPEYLREFEKILKAHGI